MNARETTEGKVVILDRGEYTTCTIHLKGCTILSWRICNEEQIFMSKKTSFSEYGKIRGGVQLIFPHHKHWSFGRQHGFGRNIMWKVVRGPEFLDNGDVFVDIACHPDYFTRSMWNFEFALAYRITLHMNKLSMRIIVRNNSKYLSLNFHLMLQCYIKVNDIKEVEIRGLQNCLNDDLLSAIGTSMSREKSDKLKIVGNLDKLFLDTPNEIKMFISDKKLVTMIKENVSDVKIWNPGPSKSDDIEPNEYKYFVGLEGGEGRQKITLPAGREWKMSVVLEVKDLPEKIPFYKNFYDFFEGYC